MLMMIYRRKRSLCQEAKPVLLLCVILLLWYLEMKEYLILFRVLSPPLVFWILTTIHL